MVIKMNRLFLALSILYFSCIFSNTKGDLSVIDENDSNTLIWCTTNSEETKKCENFAHAAARDKQSFKKNYLELKCKQAFDREECMTWLDEERAHITSLDTGEVFVGGRYHSLVPIVQEIYEGGFKYYYAVAAIKKGTLPEVRTLEDLRGKRGCFAEVGTLAGWVIPIYTLMKRGGLEIIDCNNHVKSAINFFGPSCAVNSLINKYNPIGDNSDKLCQLCTGKVPGGKCTRADPYAGYQGAFRCLLEAGDIAFLKHSTINQMISRGEEFSSVTASNFELLCLDGSRRPIDEYRSCNWGTVPSHAVVTTSAIKLEQRQKYQTFITTAGRLYSQKDPNKLLYNSTNLNNQYDNRFGSNRNDLYNRDFSSYTTTTTTNRYDSRNLDYNRRGNLNEVDQNNETQFYEMFNIFESAPKYGILFNLMFQDNTIDLVALDEQQQSYMNYLGKSLDLILGIRDCPINRMTLCVTSDAELEKCIKMRTALKAQLLKPEMVCSKAHSHIRCMQAIKSGAADVTMLDASDVYTAGLRYDLVPFISEVYNLGSDDYYAVAVAKEQDPSTELTYLKGKYTCHTGINMAAGWVYPLAYLISNGWIRPYGCNSIRAAAEYFSKSCIPGATSSEYNTDVPYDNMCDLCHGASSRYCHRDASEDYYGHTGALRCLVEGGGDVAFVKHTTVMENTDSKRREWWARDTLNGDFELLCPDGTRAEVTEFKKCNLGKVKANALVTRGGYGYNETEINSFINLFVYSQQFYGRKEADEFSFSMFYSQPPYSDLIFQDAAQQLRIIEPQKREFSEYLGKDFMRARRIVDCHAGASVSVTFSLIGTICSALLTIMISRGYF